MPPFRKPTVRYDYDLDAELKALREYPRRRPSRAIPGKSDDTLLVATWNIANLGVQRRRDKDYRLIAEIIGWFDMVAIQEVNDDLTGLRSIQEHLPRRYRALFSDPGGNNERFAFLFDADKIEPMEEIGEVTVPAKDLPKVTLPGIRQRFSGFDRNPYLGAFRAGDLDFVLANVHLYFGSGSAALSIARRCLEAYAVARWAELRRRSKKSYTQNILALGDFNLPRRVPSDAVYRALTRRGLEIPKHSTRIGSNLAGDAHYDQMALFPGAVQDALERVGVFDFDGAVFEDLWSRDEKQQRRFRDYVKYYLSDHRPLWAELRIS